MKRGLPGRQIHLDFHTSEHITGIGAGFDPEAFAATLADAQVESVVLFAKCHHGWSYTNTKVGARHPHLAFDLLRAQVDACQARGIRTPIYLSVGWDERAARREAGWRRILPDGSFHMMLGKNLDPYWSYLCLNTPYLDEVIAQIDEIVRCFPEADSLWLDIVRQEQCCCASCRTDMDRQGLDWTKEPDRRAHARYVFDRYLERAAAAAHAVRPGLSLFHNTSMAPRGDRRLYDAFGHIEIEAVPTGGWGYDHFPLSARYIDPWVNDFMGVTVRFHIVWGELQALKHPNALRAEAMIMLAHGAKVCVGDHLDPSGVLDADAYKMIGATFDEVASKSPFLAGSRPMADIGLLSSVAVREPGAVRRDLRHIPEDEGAVRVLSQGHHQFDVLDLASDFDRYRALVLPDRIRLSPDLARRLEAYVAGGGALLLTGESGLTPDASGFALDVGADYFGPSPFDPTFVALAPELAPSFVAGPMALMTPSFRIKASFGAALGDVYEPRLQRSPRAFSSHIYAPPEPHPSDYDAGVRHGRIVYLPHPIFSLYRKLGHASVRDMALNALSLALDGAPLVRTDAPKSAIVTLRKSAEEQRLLLQIVYAPRELRGDTVLGPLEVIEDMPRLTDVAFDVAVGGNVRAVRVEPDGRALAFKQTLNRVQFKLDALEGHALVLIALQSA